MEENLLEFLQKTAELFGINYTIEEIEGEAILFTAIGVSPNKITEQS